MLESFTVANLIDGSQRDVHATLYKAIIDFAKRFESKQPAVFIFDNGLMLNNIGYLQLYIAKVYGPPWSVIEPLAKLQYKLIQKDHSKTPIVDAVSI